MFACSGMQILMKLKISYQGCDTYQYFSDTLDLINKETSLLHMYLYGIENDAVNRSQEYWCMMDIYRLWNDKL